MGKSGKTINTKYIVKKIHNNHNLTVEQANKLAYIFQNNMLRLLAKKQINKISVKDVFAIEPRLTPFIKLKQCQKNKKK